MKPKKKKPTAILQPSPPPAPDVPPAAAASPAPASAGTGRARKKRGAPSVINFLKRVGGMPHVDNTPAKGLLGSISATDLAEAGRLGAGNGDAGPEHAPAATVVAELAEPAGRYDRFEEVSADDAVAAERINRARALRAPTRRADSESRDAARIDVALPVEFSNAGRVEVDLASNISTRGAFVRTATPLDVGDPLLLTFEVPGARFPLQVAARVRWVTPFADAESGRPGMGVEFVALDERKRSALEQLLQVTRAGETR